MNTDTAQNNINRCYMCNKKLKYTTTFKCKCDLLFCNTHRYSDIHLCTFDYKSHAKSELLKKNPIIQSEKIVKL